MLTNAGFDATDSAINDISVTPPGAKDIKSVTAVNSDKFWSMITKMNARISIVITDNADRRAAVKRTRLSIPKNLAPRLVPIITCATTISMSGS